MQQPHDVVGEAGSPNDDELNPFSVALDAFDRDDDEALVAVLRTAMPSLWESTAEAVTTESSSAEGARGLMNWASSRRAIVWHGRALFAITARTQPTLLVGEAPATQLRQLANTDVWAAAVPIETGRTTAFEFVVGGRHLGVGDIPGYIAASYRVSGRPIGRLLGPFSIASKIYPGTSTTYWLYVNPGADADRAPVMVWTDGDWFLDAVDASGHRLQVVSDNLVAEGKIPPLVHVLTTQEQDPPYVDELQYTGQTSRALLRSVQYDTMSPRFAHHLVDELLPDVERSIAVRTDAYSRAIAGSSSGGMGAFTAAWSRPDDFSRVLSHIGSFTGLRWEGGPAEHAGFLLPFLVRREWKNLRVWLSDGQWDVAVDRDGRADMAGAGNWPIANILMADALKSSGLDFHFRFGTAGHNDAQAALDLPESLTWLWRDYDAGRTHQRFEQDAEERAEPMFRVQIANRRSW